ncbi:hypothetical protein SDC9_125623 [bioreactor metagenome]|uniref:Uncharacterized protein n=1 Tax=bioreactor metagenome TaxID=1076179 RepID=A0A645CPC6_9ZZZZ|nr:hypothetical protein [Candidatus Pelethousia sp.]
MKKIFCLMLAVAMLFSVAACAAPSEEAPAVAEAEGEAAEAATPEGEAPIP